MARIENVKFHLQVIKMTLRHPKFSNQRKLEGIEKSVLGIARALVSSYNPEHI